MNYGCEVNRTPFCCGMMEAGSFVEVEECASWRKVHAQTPNELLQKVLEEYRGYPVLFNFYQEVEWDNDTISWQASTYTMEALREEVMKHPKAMHLCERINPNSGNRVDSWMIFEGEIPYNRDDNGY